MAAKKKAKKDEAEKVSKKVSKKAAAKKEAAQGSSQGRGRKAVLKGELTQDQKKRVRRVLRANDVRLSDLPDGQDAEATVKNGVITIKVGKQSFELSAEPQPRVAKESS